MAVELSRLTYTYPGTPAPALESVDLRLDGGLTLVTGASGSGKSTLLRLFNGLIPHFHGGTIEGTVRVFGKDTLTTTTRELARDVGFVFQDPELQSVYATVERDAAFGLENLCVPPEEMRQRVDAALEQVKLAQLRSRAVSTLSGGERQRLAIAGVLAAKPRLLVLDEPLSQLDAAGAAAVAEILAALPAQGISVVIAEHRLEHLLAHAPRILHMRGGRLHQGLPTDSETVRGATRLPHAPTALSQWSLRDVAAGFDGTVLLRGFTLNGAGGCTVVMGPNGSGKTTLLRVIAGLLAPLSGTAERSAQHVAYLPQNPSALLHRKTVRAELEWTLQRRGGIGMEMVESTLRQFGLNHVADRYPRDLSTGERQRAAIAAVLTGTPDLVLLDEPTRGMDVAARRALITAIDERCAAGASVVLATHDGELARRVATRIVRLGAAGSHGGTTESTATP